MDELAAESPIGANGVFFHPYLQGERSPYWDSDLRGSFTGIGMGSTRGDFSRALLEGVGFSLLDCYGLIEEMKLPVKRLFLIGGGGRSRLWSEIVCNIFNLPLTVPSPGDASFGAALLAGTGIGIFKDSRSAVKQCLKIDRELTPDPEAAEQYRKLFRTYKAIHDAMAPVYHTLKR
jgi:Sugar (pentulose and hexulose) kinases